MPDPGFVPAAWGGPRHGPGRHRLAGRVAGSGLPRGARARERARPDKEGAARATEQEADPSSAHAASAGNARTLPGRAARPTADAGQTGPPPFAAARPGSPRRPAGPAKAPGDHKPGRWFSAAFHQPVSAGAGTWGRPRRGPARRRQSQLLTICLHGWQLSAEAPAARVFGARQASAWCLVHARLRAAPIGRRSPFPASFLIANIINC